MEASQNFNIYNQSCLFKALREDEVNLLAKKTKLQQFNSGETIYTASQTADTLYFIAQGKVRLLYQDGEHSLGVLSEGDYFGIDCLISPFQRFYTAVSETDTILLCLNQKVLWRLASQNPNFLHTLSISVKTREILPNIDLSWKEDDEFILLYTRRHAFFLWLSCAFAFFICLLGFSILLLGIYMHWEWLWISGILVILFAIGTGAWLIIDYLNDTYCVTTQRVIWVEKVLGLYDTRQEAPLSSIRAIDITTSWFSRLIGFGSISIRTFTSSILIKDINNPQFVADLIEEYRQRWTNKLMLEKDFNLRQTLRRELGFEESPEAKGQITFSQSKPTSMYPSRNSMRLKFIIDFFKMRIEDIHGVTFRKHWLILISKIWLPVLSACAMLWGWFSFIFNEQTTKIIPPFEGSLLFAVLIGACFLWSAYYVIDWSNDLYQVTANQIVDMEKKPLGRENKKTASLESVLSVTVLRKNLIGLLFNFGDVKIDTGGTIFVFSNIADPNSACAEISRRVDQMRERNEQAKVIEENRRYLEWLAAYHKEIASKEGISEE